MTARPMGGKAADRLGDLLLRQRAAIRGGAFAALPGLMAGMPALIEEVRATADGGTAARLRAEAERNAGLLQAALRGIASARRRVADLRGAAAGAFTGYDGRGRPARIAGPAPRVERRA
jgi:hypothetical protein